MPEPEPSSPCSSRVDRLSALVSGFVAVLALGVATYNVVLQRQQIRAQVYPRLAWGDTKGNGKGFSYVVLNSGVGPGEIMSACVRLDGVPVASWQQLLDRLLEKLPPSDRVFAHSTVSGRVLAPGEVIHPLELADGPAAQLLLETSNRVRAELCYCSTLGECWATVGRKAWSVDACPPCAEPFVD